MMVRFATGFHLLVLFVFFLEDGGLSEASLFRQMADVADYLPHLVVFDNSFPGGHAGGVYSINQNPVQLAIGVGLHVGGLQVCNRRGHLGRKRHAGILSIETVANLAMMSEMPLAFIDRGLVIRD